MKGWIVITILLAVLLGGCANTAATNQSPATASTPVIVALAPDIPTAALVNTSCADDKVNSIGSSITSSYSFTSVEEVVSWFCAGAGFEDILSALETEELTGLPAEDLLRLRAEGLGWEEIWNVSGLNDR
jgi:PBP1b-binding outer membrane lipoprotein LpoB